MSKSSPKEETQGVLDKLGRKAIEYYQELPPSSTYSAPGRFKTFLHSIDVGITAEKITAKHPDTPQWQVNIAALAGTYASMATSEFLETAIIGATSSFVAITGTTGTPVAFLLFYEGQVIIAESANYANESVSELTLKAIDPGMWADFLLDHRHEVKEVIYYLATKDGDIVTIDAKKNTDNVEISVSTDKGKEIPAQEIADAMLQLQQSGKLKDTFLDVSHLTIAVPDGQYSAYLGSDRAEVTAYPACYPEEPPQYNDGEKEEGSHYHPDHGEKEKEKSRDDDRYDDVGSSGQQYVPSVHGHDYNTLFARVNI